MQCNSNDEDGTRREDGVSLRVENKTPFYIERFGALIRLLNGRRKCRGKTGGPSQQLSFFIIA
jgi:hypothetical protein